ncbi:LLM class flavin-dependent oxidoreductase [Parageobacillus thermoglucosidasius]|uniref:Alkanesulfonate monooxygenase n=1 Tax=Parageobacillus thermoglucosidasius TaxID=1426 RepID=A0AAN0YQ80_PARTM|nr:LLM class flavin-dependent oxidoreductase [Parageobacillus thermoglucosidasius]ALF08856.1 alkanesulfonate monooxygenase [Parageobacillus thermoglucosidasius]ANZ28938.1 alkanesulfonate monooxygenase [Parageobacillus thermoglucosidasius]APM79677.1 alkanesulfonate monooxygenase [Parageobacillus thermoglucosidasius]KJX69445.1 alkanesulfonate monooxygenase [Parageobacillus thermoglucosidasius]RDE23126.1 LLM class flavin-dependent oxidoreductase [Parageobacillus thermoglucosidasius]
MVEFITMAPTSGDSTLVGLANNSSKLNSWTGTDENAERPPTQEYIKAIAQAAEKGGFSTLLLPTGTGCLDSLAVAANLIAYTSKLKFLFAIRPGFIAPATFAKQFATVDYWSNGRALVNIVTGGSPVELASEGDYLDHDTRYKRTREYMQILKKLFTEESVDYEGEFFTLKGASLFPKPVKTPLIYFGGASEIAKEVAAEEADVYMMWGETFENTKQRLEEMKQRAAKHNRTLSYSVSFQVILGNTEEEAWEKANKLISKVSASILAKKEEMIAKGDSIGAKRLHQLMESSKERNFKIGPNLWAGLTQVLSGNSIALVGTPEQIAERIVELVELGFDKVLLRGFPHLETIEQLGELVIPKVREKLAQKQLVK